MSSNRDWKKGMVCIQCGARTPDEPCRELHGWYHDWRSEPEPTWECSCGASNQADSLECATCTPKESDSDG